MKMTRISANVRELLTADGTRILISYSTPVAMLLPNGILLETSKKWSSSTARQISKWKASFDYPTTGEVLQETLNVTAREAGFDEPIGAWKQWDGVKYGIKEYNQKMKHQPF